MKKNHQKMEKIGGEERKVTLKQKHLNDMRSNIPQESQLMPKLRKVKNMTRPSTLEEPDVYAYPRVPNTAYARDTYKVKVEIPTFNGNIDIEGCLDWLYEVETFFEVMNIPEDH